MDGSIIHDLTTLYKLRGYLTSNDMTASVNYEGLMKQRSWVTSTYHPGTHLEPTSRIQDRTLASWTNLTRLNYVSFFHTFDRTQLHGDAFGGGISNYKSRKNFPKRQNMATLTRGLPARFVAFPLPTAAVSPAALAVNMREHDASCRPVCSGGERPTSTSAAQLSPHPSMYSLAKFRFHW
jgi:hypothetical protein